MHKKGISLNSVEKSLSHSADKIRRRTLLCFERILVSKIFKQSRGEASRFCREFFYLTGAKKLRQGTILCFRKFLVGKNILCIRGGGGYHDFPSKFLSHCTEIFHWRTLWCFRKILLSKIFMHNRGGGILVLSKFFVSQNRNGKLCKGTLLFSGSFLVSKKKLWIRGGISRFSIENLLSHSTEKLCRGTLLCSRKILVSKNVRDKRGGKYHNFRRIFLSHSAKKIRRGIL